MGSFVIMRSKSFYIAYDGIHLGKKFIRAINYLFELFSRLYPLNKTLIFVVSEVDEGEIGFEVRLVESSIAHSKILDTLSEKDPDFCIKIFLYDNDLDLSLAKVFLEILFFIVKRDSLAEYDTLGHFAFSLLDDEKRNQFEMDLAYLVLNVFEVDKRKLQ